MSLRRTTRARARSRVLRPAVGSATRRPLLAGLAVAALLASGWMLRSSTTTSYTAAQSDEILHTLRVDVLRTLSHDTSAYTQGLLWWEGALYESTGQYGQSDLRRIDPATGRVKQRVDIPPAWFGEGLARVGDRLIMLTWKAQRALVHPVQCLSLC